MFDRLRSALSALSFGALAVASLAMPAFAGAQATPESTHDELRALRDECLAALRAADFEALLAHAHPNIVVTVENGNVIRGTTRLGEFYKETLAGPESHLEGFSVSDFESDELSILYGGDTAIAFGSAELEYRPRGGDPLNERARWSAVLVREGDRWLIASLHTSVDFSSNELMRRAVQWTMLMSGAIAAIAGLLVGAVAGLFLGRRRKGGKPASGHGG